MPAPSYPSTAEVVRDGKPSSPAASPDGPAPRSCRAIIQTAKELKACNGGTLTAGIQPRMGRRMGAWGIAPQAEASRARCLTRSHRAGAAWGDAPRRSHAASSGAEIRAAARRFSSQTSSLGNLTDERHRLFPGAFSVEPRQNPLDRPCMGLPGQRPVSSRQTPSPTGMLRSPRAALTTYRSRLGHCLRPSRNRLRQWVRPQDIGAGVVDHEVGTEAVQRFRQVFVKGIQVFFPVHSVKAKVPPMSSSTLRPGEDGLLEKSRGMCAHGPGPQGVGGAVALVGIRIDHQGCGDASLGP